MSTGRLKGMIPYATLLGGAAYLFFLAGHFAFAAKPGEIGPGAWPKAILGLLMAVCAYEIVRRLLSSEQREARAATEAPAAGGGADVEGARGERQPLLLGTGIALTILYVYALGSLGFFIATTLYLALFMVVGRYRRFGVLAATSILGSLAFVFVFMKIVYVSLPLGTGPFQTVSVWILAALGIR